MYVKADKHWSEWTNATSEAFKVLRTSQLVNNKYKYKHIMHIQL